jgi:biopolymer transport protein ExbD
LDKSPITPAELTGAVRPALEKNNDIPGFEEQPNQEVPSVIIAADEEVAYDYVMKVLNAVKDSGLLKIGLTAIPKEG